MNEAAATDETPGATPAKRSRARRLLRCAQWALNLLVLAAAVFVLTPIGDWTAGLLVDVDPLVKADCIVVLGGNRGRAVEAARLYREGWAERVIVTSTTDGAGPLAEVAIEYGVPREKVVIDNKATRTADHPRTVAALPGVDKAASRVLIVTSPLHTRRARACFRQAGYRRICMRAPAWELDEELRLLPQDVKGRARRLPSVVYEALAWVYYKLLGWI